MKKPPTKRIHIVVLKGIAKGLIYYIVYYILLFGFIIYFIVPFIADSVGLENINTAQLMNYSYLNLTVLAWFLGLYTTMQLVKSYVPYSALAESAIHLAAIYIILLSINFGRIGTVIPEYNTSVYLDASPLLINIFYILAAFGFGGALISVAKEYKRRHQAPDRERR